MVVRITKARHAERPHTLTCFRDDGTSCGQRSHDFFIRHDLTHFAVESVLGYREAFYGLLNQGWDFSTFEEREPGSAKVRSMPLEAGKAECLAGAFDVELTAGPQPNETIAALFAEYGIAAPEITVESIARIRARRDDLLARWHALSPGESMELQFPPLAASR